VVSHVAGAVDAASVVGVAALDHIHVHAELSLVLRRIKWNIHPCSTALSSSLTIEKFSCLVNGNDVIVYTNLIKLRMQKPAQEFFSRIIKE